MSTYVLMRLLESAPARYELGIRLLTFGRIGRSYERLTSWLEPGDRVLDIGCGTGALSRRAAVRGASVVGIDINAGMLEIAKRQSREKGLGDRIELREMGVAELGSEPPASYDAVLGGLCFSELSDDELAYTLDQTRRLLKPRGLLLVADEACPEGRIRCALFGAIRAPLAALTFLLAQQTSRPLQGIEARIQQAGLAIVSVRRSGISGLVEIVARNDMEVAG